MGIVGDGYVPDRGTRHFLPTDKEVDASDSRSMLAYAFLRDEIRETFGEEGTTIQEAYRQITSTKGLSLDDTRSLMHGAKNTGFLVARNK